MGHKVRAYAQFYEIEKMYKALKEGHVIITLDHKQKTLTMKHREGYRTYFNTSRLTPSDSHTAPKT